MSELKITPVVIDCDPGTDDVTSMMYLFAQPNIRVVGITPVGGNKEIDMCEEISLAVCEFFHMENIPVCHGADRPIFGGKNITVPGYCLGDAKLPKPQKTIEDKYAWDFIYEQAVKYDGELEVLAIGPHMNIAKALLKYPDLPRRIKRIVMMGGANGVGNITPAAEFNIWADPYSSDIIMKSGIPIVMMGLDICKKAYITGDELGLIKSKGKVGCFIAEAIGGPIMNAVSRGMPGGCQCDPTAAVYMVHPEIFEMEDVHIAVETKGQITMGKTVFTRRSTQHVHLEPNGMLGVDLDRTAFVSEIISSIEIMDKKTTAGMME